MVPLILSFVSDRSAVKLLTGRCLNGVWQDGVGFSPSSALKPALPGLRRPKASEPSLTVSGASMPLARHSKDRLRTVRQP